VALALFDLDNTLLNGDSDHSWGIYLAEIGAVDPQLQKDKQDYFYQQYLAGELDIQEFCEFQFKVLTENSVEQLNAWHRDYMTNANDDIIIITATNDFITAPIAKRLGVEALIATTAEFIDGHYTGKVSGTPCFQEGKITRLNEWLNANNVPFENSYFYSDSINDLPLLQKVDTPIAVTPDDKLREYAKTHHWEIID